MKKKGIVKSLAVKAFFTLVIAYCGYILVQQQLVLNAYNADGKYYKDKIEQERKQTEILKSRQAVQNSDEYIERIAREKLGLVKPDEKVFIDISNK